MQVLIAIWVIFIITLGKTQAEDCVQIIPDSVSQSSRYSWDPHGNFKTGGLAVNAIDGNVTTKSHTKCSRDTEIWFKMSFDAVYCFKQIVIIQSHFHRNAWRMENLKVYVTNSHSSSEALCGVLEPIRKEWTVTGQTYKIWCDMKSCGDEVELRVIHDSSYKREACIHMREIAAYADPNSVTCSAGQYLDMTTIKECQDCEAGGITSPCTNCEAGTYSAAGSEYCTDCVAGTYSAAGSESCTECTAGSEANQDNTECGTNKSYFSDIVVDGYIYHPWPSRIIEQGTMFQLIFESLNIEDCNLSIFVASINLELDLSVSADLSGKVDSYLLYSLEDEENLVSFQASQRTSVTISVKQRVTVELNGHRLSFRNGGRYTPDHQSRGNIEIAASSEECFSLRDTESYVERLVPMSVDPEQPATDPPIVTTPTPDDSSTKLSMELCEQPGFRDCEIVRITLGSKLDDLQVRSIKIASIPKDRTIVLFSDLELGYNVNGQMVDSNLSDGFSQIPGLHLEADGGTRIIAIQYVEREERAMTDSPTDPKPAESGTEHPPPQAFTESGTVYEDQKIDESYKEVKEVRDLVEGNVIFTNQSYKPDFKGKEIPVEKLNEKAKEYTENRTASNLLGFLTFNGFTDIGITKSKIKKQKELGSHEADQKSLSGLNEEAMIETVKAFQKFNGFSETGEITENQYEVLTAPRCGNRDTSYKEEVETITCVEGEVIRSDQERDLCELDKCAFPLWDICSQYPNDYSSPVATADFVWDNDYYFEVDVEFAAATTSYIGFAFNYQQDVGKADYLVVTNFRIKELLCFSHGTDLREILTGNIQERACVKFTQEQITLNQFKLRLTVKQVTQTASLAINGKRTDRFNTTVDTKSSVILFGVIGLRYENDRIRVLTSRICRRNARRGTFGSERSKRYALSNFRWYPNGKAITYSFVNHSTSLEEQGTRREIIRAVEIFSTYGFQFKELSPRLASSAEIVFMFMREGRHADGFRFLGAGAEKAHAFAPTHGEIHFNDYQAFSVNMTDDHHASLFYVALHEIGHALGIKHSSSEDAVMNARYYNEKAFRVNDLDEDDIDAVSEQYGDIISHSQRPLNPNAGNLPYESVAGITSTYHARLPIPKACLNSIDAAFHYYVRKGDGDLDKIYLISHGNIWMYEASTFAMLSGYPKRTAEVFPRAVGEIDAAFDTGKYICLIIKEKVLIYETYYTTFIYLRTKTLKSLFGISEERVKSAFNNYKGSCSRNRKVCCETTLVISPDKHYTVTWNKKGRHVQRTLAGDGISIVGESVPDRQFQAAFEYTRTSNGLNEVMQFDDGRVCRSRVHYPGENYKAKTGWADVPELFRIIGWCQAS